MRSQLLGRSQMNHLWVKSYQLSILGGKSFIIARGNQMWDKKLTWTQFLWSLCLSTFWIADTDVHTELILEPFFPWANGCVLFFSAIFPHRLLLVGRWPLDIRQPTTEEAERARKVAIQALNCTANIFRDLNCTANMFRDLNCAAHIFWAICCATNISKAFNCAANIFCALNDATNILRALNCAKNIFWALLYWKHFQDTQLCCKHFLGSLLQTFDADGIQVKTTTRFNYLVFSKRRNSSVASSCLGRDHKVGMKEIQQWLIRKSYRSEKQIQWTIGQIRQT